MENIPYSFEDLSCARDIMDDFSLYPESFWMWASKVRAWFKAFYKLVALHREKLGSQSLAISSAFQTLRKRAKSSIYTLVNTFAADHEIVKAMDKEEKPQKHATRCANFSSYDTPNDQTIKNRSAKHKRRNRVMRKTGFWYAFSR